MIIRPINDKDSVFDTVILKTDSPDIKETPHCINHGAMNKVSTFPDSSGGFWRCTTHFAPCRSGCIEDAIVETIN